MTAPLTPAERETPAGEAMGEAVALRKLLREFRQMTDIRRVAWATDPQVKREDAVALAAEKEVAAIASELARLTAERDEAQKSLTACLNDMERGDLCKRVYSDTAAGRELEAAEAALTTLRADHAAAIANAREPVGDAWDEVRRLEAECRVFIRERDEWKAVADHERAEHAAEVARKDAEIARLRIAFHDAIRRPLGVTPDSGAEFYNARMADQAEARRPPLANPEPSHD